MNLNSINLQLIDNTVYIIKIILYNLLFGKRYFEFKYMSFAPTSSFVAYRPPVPVLGSSQVYS